MMPDMKTLFGWPKSRMGDAAMASGALFLLFLLIFNLLIRYGERGGERFFDNPLLAVTLLLAAASGMAMGVLSVAAIVLRKERAAVLFVGTVFGAFVTLFVLLELFRGG